MRPIIPIPAFILAVVTILLAIILFVPARASDDTCRLQERLSERGYFTGEITCTYGDRTEARMNGGFHLSRTDCDECPLYEPPAVDSAALQSD